MCIYRNNLRCNVYFVIRSSLVNAVSSLRLALLVCCHWCSCSEGEEATEAAAVCVLRSSALGVVYSSSLWL